MPPVPQKPKQQAQQQPAAVKTAVSPTRQEDFPEWYQQVVRAADLAENSEVRGCMVIKPWGYGIWEQMQDQLDTHFKATGHVNAYFPLLIPLSYLEKEAEHAEGFATECAVVRESRNISPRALHHPPHLGNHHRRSLCPLGAELPGPAHPDQSMGQRDAMGDAAAALSPDRRVSLARGSHRARDQGGSH